MRKSLLIAAAIVSVVAFTGCKGNIYIRMCFLNSFNTFRSSYKTNKLNIFCSSLFDVFNCHIGTSTCCKHWI